MASFKFRLIVWLALAALIFELSLSSDDDDYDDADSDADADDNDNDNDAIGEYVATTQLMSILAFFRDLETGQILCIGSIIGNKHILTAASCFQHKDVKEVIVTLDQNEPLIDGIGYSISEKITPKEYSHPNEGETIAWSNIAILILEKEFEPGDWSITEFGNDEDIRSTMRIKAPVRTLIANVKIESFSEIYSYPAIIREYEECKSVYSQFTCDFLCGETRETHSSDILIGGPLITASKNPHVIGIILDIQSVTIETEQVFLLFSVKTSIHTAWIGRVLEKYN